MPFIHTEKWVWPKLQRALRAIFLPCQLLIPAAAYGRRWSHLMHQAHGVLGPTLRMGHSGVATASMATIMAKC